MCLRPTGAQCRRDGKLPGGRKTPVCSMAFAFRSPLQKRHETSFLRGSCRKGRGVICALSKLPRSARDNECPRRKLIIFEEESSHVAHIHHSLHGRLLCRAGRRAHRRQPLRLHVHAQAGGHRHDGRRLRRAQYRRHDPSRLDQHFRFRPAHHRRRSALWPRRRSDGRSGRRLSRSADDLRRHRDHRAVDHPARGARPGGGRRRPAAGKGAAAGGPVRPVLCGLRGGGPMHPRASSSSAC